MSKHILVLNCGSSSLKFSLVDPQSGERLLDGLAEKLGDSAARFRVTGRDAFPLDEPTHEGALQKVLNILEQEGLSQQVAAVGHRVVHGGEQFSAPTLITDEVSAALDGLSHLAPLHNPVNLKGIVAARKGFPALPHVAIFDTAFHQTMSEVAFRYPVPESWYEEHGVRRYGFHGTSHRYVAEAAAAKLGRPLADLNLLSAHLGNGCSATAISRGKSVNTSMGMTPLSGLVMGTRSGDIDPGVLVYMARRLPGGIDEVDKALNKSSGLLGLSQKSNDMRELLELEARGDKAARLAIESFCSHLASTLAGLATSLPSLDALIFTGGIGEHAAPIRERTLKKLWPLGLSSAPTPSSPQVLVIPTDEEFMIAKLSASLIK